MMTQTFALSQPVKHGTEELTLLELREPTPADVNAMGLPYRLHADLTSEPVPAVCAKYISRLAGIPPSVVEKLTLSDYTMLLYVVVSFFNASRKDQPQI